MGSEDGAGPDSETDLDSETGSEGFEGCGAGAGWLVTGAGSMRCCAAGSCDGALLVGVIWGAAGDAGDGVAAEEGVEEGGGTDGSESLRTYTSVLVLSPAPASPRDPRPRPPRPLSDAPRPVG